MPSFTSYFAAAAMFLCLPVASASLLLDMNASRGNSHPARDNRFAARADKTLELTLQNLVTFYQIELGLGTPSQKTVYTIDTGSSDLWIMNPSNPYCTNDPTAIANQQGVNCTGEYVFDPSGSSTWTTNTTQTVRTGTLGGDYNFYVAYGDTSVAMGYWGNDNVRLGNATLTNCSVAIATVSNASLSVMGIGLRSTESTFQNTYTGTNYVYQNIPYMLKDQGVISYVAYSIWLNGYNSDEGNVLFGGVDHEKYVGSLGLVPMVKLIRSEPGLSSDDPVRTAVMLHSVGLVNNNAEQATIANCSFPVLLDSGSTANYLPSSIVSALAKSIGATYNSYIDAYLYDCNTAGGLVLNFSGIKITVPLSFLALEVTTSTGESYKDKSGNTQCALGILEGSDNISIIGDAALRAAYIVYDLEKYQIALGVSNYDSTNSNEEEIVNGIPGVVSAPSYSSTISSTAITTSINTSILSKAKRSSFNTAVATHVNSMIVGGASGSNRTVVASSASPSSTRNAAPESVSNLILQILAGVVSLL